MSNPYREFPMQFVAKLNQTEVKAAILEFVANRASEDFTDAEVRLVSTPRRDAGDDLYYEITAEVVGKERDT